MAIYLKKFETTSQYNAYTADTENFIKPNVSLITETNTVEYNPYVIPPHDYSKDYLTFVALEDGTFKFTNAANYSLDGGETWTALAANTNTPTVTAGQRILWKANITPQYYVGVGTFSNGTCDFNVEGNIMSLVYGDNFVGQTSAEHGFCNLFGSNTNVVNAKNLCLPVTTLTDYYYYNMFYGCTSLTTAPELSATTLADCCYSSMFEGCTSLTTAPELPATTLSIWCYSYMFQGCTSLTTAPELSATTLTDSCYEHMFNGCTSLTSITCLATNISISAHYCTNNWVNGVASSGTFTKAVSMNSWTSGVSGIPDNWTVEDASN